MFLMACKVSLSYLGSLGIFENGSRFTTSTPKSTSPAPAAAGTFDQLRGFLKSTLSSEKLLAKPSATFSGSSFVSGFTSLEVGCC